MARAKRKAQPRSTARRPPRSGAAATGFHLRGIVARAADAAYPGPRVQRTTASAWLASAARTWTSRSIDGSHHPPVVTNQDELMYPRDGIAKKDVVAYYEDVAPVMLRYMKDRPIVGQRWPDGIDDFTRYQHRMPPRAPASSVRSGSRQSPHLRHLVTTESAREERGGRLHLDHLQNFVGKSLVLPSSLRAVDGRPCRRRSPGARSRRASIRGRSRSGRCGGGSTPWAISPSRSSDRARAISGT